MDKRKAKRFTIRSPFSRLIVYVDTDDTDKLRTFEEAWRKRFVWWRLWRRTIFLPKGAVEVVRI